jgi:hypothetical protein
MLLFDILQYQHQGDQAAYFSSLVLKIHVWRETPQVNSLFSAKFRLKISMDEGISIHLYCNFLDLWLRLLLRLMKVLLEYGLSGHAAGDCGLGWFRDGSDGAVLLLRLLLRVEKI